MISSAPHILLQVLIWMEYSHRFQIRHTEYVPLSKVYDCIWTVLFFRHYFPIMYQILQVLSPAQVICSLL